MKKILEISLLVFFDLLFYYISVILAYYTGSLFGEIIGDFSLSTMLSYWWLPLIMLLTFENEQLYTTRKPFWDETKKIFKLMSLTILIVFVMLSVGEFSNKLPRSIVLSLWAYAIVLLPIGRFLIKHFLYKFDFFKRRTIVIGAGRAGRAAVEELDNQDYLGTSVIGFLDDDAAKQGQVYKIGKQNVKVLGKIGDYENFLDKEPYVDIAILALPTLAADRLSKIIVDIQKCVKVLLIVPEINGVSPLNTETYHVYDLDILMLRVNNNVRSGFNQVVKRVFDLVVSILLLPILLPVIAILAFFIKKESPGPVFYAHNRIGRDGEIVPVMKFRSMFSDSQERLKELLESDPEIRKEWETNYKLKNDPRVTKIGNIIRKTSLDELPQIFNVLKGNMSLVGPRPVVADELEKYYGDSAEYYKMVKPGITGFWQVSGRSDTDYDFRVKVDTWYIYNWSLWLDIMVLIKTVRVVLLREGAY